MKAILILVQLLFVASTFSYDMNLEKVDLNFFRDLQHSRPSETAKTIEKDLLSAEFLPPQSLLIEVSKNLHLQKYIDEVFLEMFSTEMGTSLCPAVGIEKISVQGLLGVHEKTASIIAKKCFDYLSKIVTKKELEAYKGISKFNKSYVFVLNSQLDFPLDSWTSMFNITYIFVDNLMPRIEFFKRILHEFYVSYDQKFLFGKQTYEMMLSDIYKISSKKLFGTGGKSELEKIAGIYPYPLVKNSFLILRAIIFESWVLHEFQKHRGVLKEYDIMGFFEKIETNCEDTLEDVMRSLLDYQIHLLPFEYSILSLEDRALSAQGLIFNEKAPKTISDLFRENKALIKDVKAKRTYSVCQFLVMPQIGNLSTFYTRGPRPRIKTGWGTGSDDRIKEIEIPNLSYEMIRSDKEMFQDFIDENVDSSLILKRKEELNLNEVEKFYKLDEERK